MRRARPRPRLAGDAPVRTAIGLATFHDAALIANDQFTFGERARDPAPFLDRFALRGEQPAVALVGAQQLPPVRPRRYHMERNSLTHEASNRGLAYENGKEACRAVGTTLHASWVHPTFRSLREHGSE